MEDKEHKLTSKCETFAPNVKLRGFGQLVFIVTGVIAGIVAWVIFRLRGEWPNARIVSSAGIVLAVAMIVAGLTDMLRGRRLRLCLDQQTLTVVTYSSKKTVRFSEIDEVIDSVDSTVLVSGGRKIVIDDSFFNSAEDKARFINGLNTRLNY